METLSRNLLLVSRRAQTCVGEIAKKYGLSAAEQPFFMAIRKQSGLTQEELTALVGVDKAMTTRVIRSLESKGFIRKAQDERDKRQNLIYKTEKVDLIEAQLQADLFEFNACFTAGIDESELENFMRILKRMNHNLTQYLERGGNRDGKNA